MEEPIDTKYLNGFNTAYLMLQYDAELFKKLMQTQSKDIFFKGMNDGKEQHYKEQIHNRISELNHLKDKGRDLDLER